MKIVNSGATSTSITFQASNYGGSAVSFEIQYATRPDFQFCPAPMFTIAAAAQFTISGLSQANRYAVRVREVAADGKRGSWSDVEIIFTPAGVLRSLAPAAIMIEPAIIVLPEIVLDWSSSNEIPGHPVRLLGRDDPNTAWWAKAVNGKVSFGMRLSGAPIDTIAVLDTVAGEEATITIRAAETADALASSPLFTLGPIPFRASQNLPGRRAYHSLIRLPDPLSYRFWNVEIAGIFPGGVFAASHAVAGLSHSTKNYSVDSKSDVLIDTGSIERDRTGSPDRVAGYRGRQVDFEISQMTEAQYEGQFSQIRWRVGTTDPVLVVPNTKRGTMIHDRILYGQLTKDRSVNNSSPRFSQEFSISSVI